MLTEVLIPMIPLAAIPSVQPLLPNPAVDCSGIDVVASLWRVVSMRTASSWEPTRLLDPLNETGSVLIAELGKVWAGRLDASKFKEGPFPGGTPALRPSDVGRLMTPRWWAEAQSSDVIKPESIMVGALSARVATSEQPVAIARDVLVVDILTRPTLNAAEVRDRVVAYLSSALGQRRLSLQKKGLIPRLSKKNFLQVRIPAPEQLPATSPSVTELLETSLERALWS